MNTTDAAPVSPATTNSTPASTVSGKKRRADDAEVGSDDEPVHKLLRPRVFITMDEVALNSGDECVQNFSVVSLATYVVSCARWAFVPPSGSNAGHMNFDENLDPWDIIDDHVYDDTDFEGVMWRGAFAKCRNANEAAFVLGCIFVVHLSRDEHYEHVRSAKTQSMRQALRLLKAGQEKDWQVAKLIIDQLGEVPRSAMRYVSE